MQNLRKLFSDCYTSNIASGRVLEKCGFKLEAVIKGKYKLNGEIHDNSW
ncbi:MAG: GNAT family N-acetyltransferase [Lentisphaerae bacterium]|nr:GNAT family N-acetyltransferase [Lentisphaerota bacterium]MCP4103804.1 GNAT family N-acetyltransferase [Lentisphaerota bacterium]